jgi:putative DNA primase/helicase
VVSLAGEDRRVAATVSQWDTDPWLLNTPDGTIDLKTGKMREHRPEDYITKMTSVGPDPKCKTPLWSAFLEKVTKEDKELQAFLARCCGYALTGDVSEHALFFLHGSGRNGKGVFLNTIIKIIGDYHEGAPIETFIVSTHDRHPTELAGLRGARMVTASETEEGQRWAEAKIKALTGGDIIQARFMRQDFFKFWPQFKLFIAGNHKPSLRSVDEAIQSRMNWIPFLVTIPRNERDKDLLVKLEVEWPGILAWAVEGCKQWRKVGLNPPQVVSEATKEYMLAEDAIGRWIEDCCVTDKSAWTTTELLFAAFKNWAEHANEFVGSRKRFTMMLEERGFKAERRNDRGFIGLKPDTGSGSSKGSGSGSF